MINKTQIREKIKRNHPQFFKLVEKLFAPYFFIKKLLKYKKEKSLIKKVVFLQESALKRLKGKTRIRCVFFATEIADWKCDSVYCKMSEHPRFEPIILVCPIVNGGEHYLKIKMDESMTFFDKKGYHPIKSYNAESGEYIDVRKDLKPDIIFYTSPYDNFMAECFNLSHFLDFLTIYLPYGFTNNGDLSFQYNLFLHNMVWRYYVESVDHLQYAINESRCRGRNAVVTGYPAIEGFIGSHYVLSLDSWKLKDCQKKRIIWAPHHTIKPEGNVSYSCFLNYADFMIEIAKKYKDSVQFVFKPHPLLRKKLEDFWGKVKTDAYFLQWENMPNTSIAEGDYIDLFLSSDAMIHDSGSFLVEYLYVNKPVMRTLNGVPLEKLYNSFVLKCLNHYYLAHHKQDIEQFVINVINGIDPLKEQRTKFVNEVLMPKGSPSQNIINDILDSIDHQILYRN